VVFGVVVFGWIIASSLKFCFLVVGIAAAVLVFGSQQLRKIPVDVSGPLAFTPVTLFDLART
jgi:hypothetical protein